MMRRVTIAALFALLPAIASAQMAVIAPDLPAADSSNRIANSRFLASEISRNSTHFAAGGTATCVGNALTISTVSPPVFSFTGNPTVTFTAGCSPNGATTLNVAGSGAKNVLRKTATGLVALVTNDIINGQQYLATYDGTQYELQTPSSLLPSSASALGGVTSATAGANQFQTGISTAGAPTFAQPAFSNLSGSLAAAQLPVGTYAETINTFTADHTIATTDCGNIVQMGTGSTGKLTSTLPSVSGFTAPCPVTIVNGDTARGKILVGYPSPCLNNTLNGSNGILFPGQAETVAIVNGAWATVNCPGRWRPTSAVTFTIDTAGSDTTGDGLGTAGATSLRSIGQCVLLVNNGLDYSSALGQPTCAPTSGQTYTESVTLATPYVGTNTLNIAGNGGQFTWKPSGANPYVVLVGNYANLQLANVIISGNGSTCGTTCTLVSLHNVAIFETLANVTCDNTGSSGACVKTDQNTAGGGRINIDSGMTLTGTVGTVIQTNSGTTTFWSSTLTASGGPAVSQIFQAIGAGTNIFIAGNFATSGAFGGARQWAVLNNAVLCNVSGTAVPGATPGIAAAATFANGVIVNAGVSAGGC